MLPPVTPPCVRTLSLRCVVSVRLPWLILLINPFQSNPVLASLQFSYRVNRSVDDAVNMALHSILQYLDNPETYVSVPFLDFSSAFNTKVPELLYIKLPQLSVPNATCQCTKDFLTNRRQWVQLGPKIVANQACVL